jgi:hypothetical protein
MLGCGAMTIDELHTEMLAGLTKLENRFKRSDARFDRFRAEMKREGKAIRIHFDVMVEKMQESVKLVAEATAHHAVRLDDHEKRTERLEDPRPT